MPVPGPEAAHPVDALRAAAHDSRTRIARTLQDGRAYWIKRQEALNGLMRIQKGNPEKAFAREIKALRELGGRGLPVPELVAQGAGFLVVPDCGPSLNLVLRDKDVPAAEKLRAMTAAGAALARLHGAGVAHGRPSIRDFCWQNGEITLIDWERYRPGPASRSRLRLDALIFVFNIYALTRSDTPEAEAAIDAYRAGAPAGLWDDAARLCRRLRWVDLLTRVQQRRDAGRGEFRAIPLTLRRFGAQ
jgi:hypothetical protein